MTQVERERLVTFIAAGHNSYQAIHETFPNLSDADLKYDEEKIIRMVDAPEEHVLHSFRPDDQFTLTEAGYDLLYQVQKEQELITIAKQSMLYAKKSYYATTITVVIGIISILIGIASFFL
ncbi:hypothetical protein [uncultured Megasphaera sp.]|uniref:hypothetical protein n=1 Tax=uncultured Megasphaera sp. TaxID=165188 RepID=UPI0025E64F9E|nr:hypothetical protein [uncultured Megasphaera sp.]